MKIHFVGIKGVGMTALAILAKEAGFTITGCDVSDEFITDSELKKAGIDALTGFSAKHLNDADLVITTGAHGGLENEEVQAAIEKTLPILTQGEAVGQFMSGKWVNRSDLVGVSIAGTHGKTTTAAMIATILKTAGKDPSYIIGTSSIPFLGAAGHFGKGKYFIAEADEYAAYPNSKKIEPKFGYQHPKIAVITNIDYDHPDIYDSINSYTNAFNNLIVNLGKKDILIVNGDDKNIETLLKDTCIVVRYGILGKNDAVVSDFHIKDGKLSFIVKTNNSSIEFELNVFGQHNVLNATAAILTCRELGLDDKAIKKGILAFHGSKRRFEYIGKLLSGALLYDDYAHHPTEIKATLQAFKVLFPDKKILCVFQPHTFSRTEKLFDQFTTAFNAADQVLITDIYASAREKNTEYSSSEKLVNAVKADHKKTLYMPTFSDVIEYIDQNRFGEDFVVVTMGAGDIYKIGDKLQVHR